MQTTFETWAKGNHPWLLEEPTDDTDRRVRAAAREAWAGGSSQMQARCAQVCRSAAQAYESRGRHSGPGWQLSVYLEREIRALLTAGQQEVGTQAGASEQTPTDATKEHEDVRALLANVRDLLNFFKSRGVNTCTPQSPVITATKPPAGAIPSSIPDDSRFLAFWVMAWMPSMFVLFLFVLPYFIKWGDAPITGICVLIFVYAVFAPAIYRVFIAGHRHSDRAT
jgi:hypothetical protein